MPKKKRQMYECAICESTWEASKGSKCKKCAKEGRTSEGIPFTK